MRSNSKASNFVAGKPAKGTPPNLVTGRRRPTTAPALSTIRSLAARVIVAELWLGIGAVALLSTLAERDFALAIALSTLFALLPSLVWVCDPVRVVARYVLSVGFVAQCVLLAVMSLQTSGPVTYGIFAFSLVLLAQIAGFICWRSLFLAGCLLIASVVAGGFWMSSATEMSPVFSDGYLTSELLDGLLPLWLLALGVLLPMAFKVERALGEAHASRLAALEAMTHAVEDARSVAINKRPNARSAVAALNLRRAVMGADIAKAAEGEVKGSPDLLNDPELKRQLSLGLDQGSADKSPGEKQGEQPGFENPVHRQQQILSRALEVRDSS
ncbi:hypothetical protein [Pelagibius sp. Alg239-R121]|uniref:hypothetical protein n=1 Tax=Pelagibius sp. Alg239-R121 TaxID=2993448 RepID=UPI0024A706C5|nr:hypothetical protein [Pelagibius sp. Alg239-R121]